MTALQKPVGCVRWIVAGDMIRRRREHNGATLSKVVKAATAPFQYA